MGVIVRWHGEEIWSPSSAVGFLFFDEVLALERAVRMRSGVVPTVADTFDIDGAAFSTFAQALIALLEGTNNAALFAMVEGCAGVVIALNARITGRWPDVSQPLRPFVEEAHHVLGVLNREAPDLPMSPYG